jgi:hypothetical protein
VFVLYGSAVHPMMARLMDRSGRLFFDRTAGKSRGPEIV